MALTMTIGSDTTFWEIRLDSLSRRLGFSMDCTQVFLCCLLLFIHVFFVAFLRLRKRYDIQTRGALQALLTIVTPTCSLWPSRYVKLASNRHLHVDIPLEMIIEDATNGVIEFRDPINDLADLIGTGTTVNGHTICIDIAWKWWINYVEWRIFSKFEANHPTPRSPSYMLGLSEWLTANPILLGLPSNPFALTSSTSRPSLYLDHLPYGVIPSLNAGCQVTLEFTAFSPSLRTLSTARIISAIPFIISERSPRRPRTLVSVLKQLSISYGTNLVVESVSNISADYERTLCHAHGLFSRERKIRETWAQSLGIKAWRRDIFLVALEAALLRRGWIERWAIQITLR